MKKNIIRVGDQVEIINPQMFVRCGYPMSLSDARIAVESKYGKEISKLISLVRGGVGESVLFSKKFMSMDKIVNELAYEYLLSNKFGGNQRTIHVVTDPKMLGKFATVNGIKYVKTGRRVSGFHSDEGEYDPPYLGQAETHKILDLSIHEMREIYLSEWCEVNRIEDKNVKKIEI